VVAIDTVLVRLIFPIAAVGLAAIAQERGWGLLNVFDTPAWIAIIVSVLAPAFRRTVFNIASSIISIIVSR
jgi:hypothetical protein